jgi:hypothetical protein
MSDWTPVVLAIPSVLVGLLVFFVIWSIFHRVRGYFRRSLKAQQDLARSVSDLADRLERLEHQKGA